MLLGNSEVEVGGGDNGDRTHDLCIANAALSQLSYVPIDSIIARLEKNTS